MPKESIHEVQAQEDFVEKLAVASPAQALAELAWNGLDAEATRLTIEADRDELGLRAIRVRDNGHAIPPEDASNLFTYLGGSWKRQATQSKNGKRVLHGKEGRGRFRALALGRVAEWCVTVKDSSGQRVRYRITMIKDTARTFRITEPEPVDDECKIGVEVTISEPYKDWNFEATGLLQELNEIYALYLTEYPTVRITLLGVKLDPTKLIELRKTIPLSSIPNGDNPPHSAELEIFEWKTKTDRLLYLCSADGFPLHRVVPGIQAPGFDFSAYLRSAYVSELNDRGALGLAELDTRLNESVENAKGKLRDYFKARAKEKLKSLVDEWKEEQVYPYAEEPVNAVQTIERQVFDIVAVNIATSLTDFQTQDQRNRKFQLRMLRHSIERSPEEVQLIISEVLGLNQRKQEELARLLKRTTLSAIISASKLVADRLDFVNGLETMLFDPDLKKNFKERSQLHRIIAENTWIFGEEFALTADDQSLTEVLRKHLKLMKRDIVVNEPVKRIDGTRGIVDLMLSRRVPSNREDEHEHLIVELKAPTVKAGSQETAQIKSYAFAVQKDERFKGVPTSWNFWLVVNDMDEYVSTEVRQSQKPIGLLWESDDLALNSRIWVKTWAQIINDCRTRLKIFQDALDYTADKDASLAYLKATYERILSGDVADELSASDTDVAPSESPNKSASPIESDEQETS